MVLAVNRAVAGGARAVVCASTGNTSASAAAYAAAAGLPCHVILPAGKVARGKLAQALAAGARLIMVDGNFDAALDAVRRLGEEGAAVVVNSINPDRLAGQQTAAWEIVDAPRAARRTHSRCRSATPATSPPTGRGFRRHADARGTASRGCSASRPRAPRRSSTARPSRRRRRSPPRFASATRRRGRARPRRATSRAALIEAVSDDEILAAQRDVVRSWRASSASPPRRRASPACVAWPPRVASVRTRWSSACSPATG